MLQWLKKLSQCFTVLARLTWHKTSILHNILKIIYVILCHLGFLTTLGHVIWIRIDQMPNKTKHSVIGTVFWPLMSECTALLSQKSGFRGVSESSFSSCVVPTYYCGSEYFLVSIHKF